MKIFLVWLFVALGVVETVFAQTQTFDLATFVPPKGWSRTISNGILTIQTRRTVQGRTEFCLINLFPSRPNNAAPEEIFQTEWEAKLARPLGLSGHPLPSQPEPISNGWMSVTGHADVVSKGVPMRVILSTVTGFGRSASVIVLVSPNSYQPELVEFFQNLNFHAPGGDHPLAVPPAAEIPASPGGPTGSDSSAGPSLSSYVYTRPPAWSQQALADGIVLRSPIYNNGEACQITMLQWRPSSQPLDAEAIGAFRAIFQTDPLTTYPSPPPTLAQGMSPQGWEYFSIKKLVGGQEGEARTRGTILLVAKVDNQVATIVATSKDFMVSQCFGLLRTDVWPQFFYSLQFKNARPRGQERAAIQQRLAGHWIMATGTVGMAYTFQADGRFSDTMATQFRTPYGTNQVLQTTTGFFGDGAYSFDGNLLVLKRDDSKRFTYFFRLEKVSKDSGRTWVDKLTLMEPGASGEYALRRE